MSGPSAQEIVLEGTERSELVHRAACYTRLHRRVPQPYVHVDRNDYSLDPRLVGRRVEVRVSQPEVIAVGLDTGVPSEAGAAGRGGVQ